MGTRRRGEVEQDEVSVAMNVSHSQTVHDRMRQQLAADVEAFLAKGGQIQQLETNAHSENYIEQVGDSDFF